MHYVNKSCSPALGWTTAFFLCLFAALMHVLVNTLTHFGKGRIGAGGWNLVVPSHPTHGAHGLAEHLVVQRHAHAIIFVAHGPVRVDTKARCFLLPCQPYTWAFIFGFI